MSDRRLPCRNDLENHRANAEYPTRANATSMFDQSAHNRMLRHVDMCHYDYRLPIRRRECLLYERDAGFCRAFDSVGSHGRFEHETYCTLILFVPHAVTPVGLYPSRHCRPYDIIQCLADEDCARPLVRPFLCHRMVGTKHRLMRRD